MQRIEQRLKQRRERVQALMREHCPDLLQEIEQFRQVFGTVTLEAVDLPGMSFGTFEEFE